MDIKSKKSRPFAAWLSFFLSLSIIGGLLLTCTAAVIDANGDWKVLETPFTGYNNTLAFKLQTRDYYDHLITLAYDSATSNNDGNNEEKTAPNELESLRLSREYLDQEGTNLKYYVINSNTGLKLTNIEGDLNSVPVSGPAGYRYVWYYDGHKLSVWDNGKTVDINRLDSGYHNIISNEYLNAPWNPNAYSTVQTAVNDYADRDKLANSRVLLAVSDTLTANPYGQSAYFRQRQFLMVLAGVYSTLAVIGFLLLLYAFLHRRDRKIYERKLAVSLGNIWLEVKLFISLIMLLLLLNISISIGGGNDPFNWVLRISLISCAVLFVLWWFYLVLLDININRRGFFTHNVVNSLIAKYNRFELKYPWQKGMLKRAYVLVAAEAVLAVVSVLFLLVSVYSSDTITLLLAILIAAAGIYILYRYLRDYDQTLVNIGKITDHIALIKSGDMQSRLDLAPENIMYQTAQNLNAIQEGMQAAVADMMKSERMKVDLITNVSHDLKTPLTSIISYVDLLLKEENLPEHVHDYIKILAQKSERLKNLIQDLFDLSKASSQNVTLETETIDLTRLIKQTLADMEEPINASGLSFRLNLPDDPVYIQSDGKKLYRVWENLITNALKYSLAGSRVFIDLTVAAGEACAIIKNIANYEMNFSEEEILQRFKRGDESRSSEGSGLGLSIAQSFTQLCGGDFKIATDGDLFKAELRFSLKNDDSKYPEIFTGN